LNVFDVVLRAGVGGVSDLVAGRARLGSCPSAGYALALMPGGLPGARLEA